MCSNLSNHQLDIDRLYTYNVIEESHSHHKPKASNGYTKIKFKKKEFIPNTRENHPSQEKRAREEQRRPKNKANKKQKQHNGNE